MTKSILFVCMGNICRSPAAENVMREKLKEAGLDKEVKIDSAGTLGLHHGQSPDPRMTDAGRRRGLPMTGSARKVTQNDFEAFDLILAMDKDNLQELQWMSANGKAELFCSFCAQHDAEEVPDPYYGGSKGFEYVLDLLEDGCSEILSKLKKERGM